jgi:hypothetical protein
MLLKGSVNLRNIRNGFGLIHQINREIAVMVTPLLFHLIRGSGARGDVGTVAESHFGK